MKKILTVLIGAVLVFGVAHAQKLYKWVDEDGNITYQDEPPPGMEIEEYAEDEQLIEDEEKASDPTVVAEENNPVTLYSITVCDACDLVRNILEKNGVPFTEKDAGGTVATQEELKKIAGQLSVPILAIGSVVVYGYDSIEIKNELLSAGYTVDGEAGTQTQDGGQATLTPEEVEEEALRSAEELTTDLDEVEEDLDFPDDLESAEEIPDDEKIKVRVGG